MKFSSKTPKNREKGQVFVLLAIIMIALVAVIGLAVDTGYFYVSYARLQRAVDAAALAGTGEFRVPESLIPPAGSTTTYPSDVTIKAARDANIVAATKQMLDLNDVNLDPTGTSGGISTTAGLSIETCENNLGDPAVILILCKTPRQKSIRVTAQERVPLFFLAVIGFKDVPFSISSLATAAAVDVMLAIDTSDSMTYGFPDGSSMRDPNECNVDFRCQPMQMVKDSAKEFVKRLYFPYDRVGLVHFDQQPRMDLALSIDRDTINDAIGALKVYEGYEDFTLNDGTTVVPTRCVYHRDDPGFNFADPANQVPVPPYKSGTTVQYANAGGPCRLFINADTGGYFQFDCPLAYGDASTYDPSWCGTTNIAGGVNLVSRALLGYYPSYITTIPEERVDSVQALILLTDGAANVAFDTDGRPICPRGTFYNSQPCRDRDSNAVHEKGTADYDADDAARYELKSAHDNHMLIFTIGLGDLVTRIPSDNTGNAPGEALLKYPTEKEPAGLGNLGKYFFASDATKLGPIFIAIANLIKSRINN